MLRFTGYLLCTFTCFVAGAVVGQIHRPYDNHCLLLAILAGVLFIGALAGFVWLDLHPAKLRR